MPKLNEVFDGVVRDLANDGNGIVEHPSGQVFFTPGVWTGEKGKFRIIGFKGQFGFARLLELTETSAARSQAPCPHHGITDSSCGGCPWMFIDYPAQLAAKEARLRYQLAKLLVDERIKPVIAAPQTLAYRNRAQLKTDGRELGYVAAGSHHLIPIKDCLVLSEPNRTTLAKVLAGLPNPRFRPAKKHAWTTIDIDESTDAENISVNARLPFRQPNAAQNAVMRQWLADQLDGLDKSLAVLELFAGSGNFTEVISQAGFGRILAVESVHEAVIALQDLRLPGVTTLTCNLFADNAFERIYHELPDCAVMVLDPPREGLQNKHGWLRKKSKLEDIFYISCNLATFTRDVREFVEQGFNVIEIQPLDQLPHTPHLEILAHLSRRKRAR